MNYFHIAIKEKKHIEQLEDTIMLIKKHCLKNSNKFSININKQMHSNCIFDKDLHFIHIYNSEKNNYEYFESHYMKKYKITKLDIEILLKVYGYINIEKIEKIKSHVKVIYIGNFICALQLIIDLLGKNEYLNQLFNLNTSLVFNQVINNNESDYKIVENNIIYNVLYDSGSMKKINIIEKHNILGKYIQYKKLQNKFAIKGTKELKKI